MWSQILRALAGRSPATVKLTNKHTPPLKLTNILHQRYMTLINQWYMTLINSGGSRCCRGLRRLQMLVQITGVNDDNLQPDFSLGSGRRVRRERRRPALAGEFDDNLQPDFSLGGCLWKKEYISSRRLHSPGLSRPNLRNLSGISSNLARYSVHRREKINICPFNGRFIKLI